MGTNADDKMLQIGKVNIDLTYYPGEDKYCDGPSEDELLRIARDYGEAEMPRIIEENKSWEFLYHLSPLRQNIVEWLPLTKDMKVLEVGAGPGAITGALAKKAGSVTCVDLSLKRSKINAYRHMDMDNVTIRVGNFLDVEKSLESDFDCICLIGVFEYGISYMGGDAPFDTFLAILKKHLKRNGRLVIAIENRFGLKYWAGCAEDHIGKYFAGLEGYPEGGPARTFTRPVLERFLRNAGIEEYSFYYPYPDYKFMHTLYSDRRLPDVGELSDNDRNFDRDRMRLFDEKKVFNTIVEEGLFPLYSNSYMIVTGPEPETAYVKYSNDRALQYQIRTEMRIEPEIVEEDPEAWKNVLVSPNAKRVIPGRTIIRKVPMTKEAEDHIRLIEVSYEALKNRYLGCDLRINRCRLMEEDGETYLELEYIPGVTLTKLMDNAVLRGDKELFGNLFARFVELIGFNQQQGIHDFDAVFSNVLITPKNERLPFDPLENGTWHLIDYEWTFPTQMDAKEQAFRALYVYLLEDERRGSLGMEDIMESIGVSPELADEIRAREGEFQKMVTGGRMSLSNMRDLIDHKITDPLEMLPDAEARKAVSKVQIYPDKGNGYSEETSYFLDNWHPDVNGEGILMIPLTSDLYHLRIDPGYQACLVTLGAVTVEKADGKERTTLPEEILSSNGIRLDKTNTYLFNTSDPQIHLNFTAHRPQQGDLLMLQISVSYINPASAASVEAAATKKIRLL